jgi:3-oxoacyl-[acyl-carrier protein] reductase
MMARSRHINGRLDGHVAVVSGAGGPMGAAIAERFAMEGARVLLIDISANRLEAVAARLRDQVPPDMIASYRASVLSSDEVEAAVAHGESELGSFDILVNVVGGIKAGSLTQSMLEMTEERWSSTFDLNLKGVLWMTKRLAPQMMERGYGRVVNISSVTYGGDRDQPEYGAAKAGVASLTRSLAMELAPHVTANCIAPGLIQTSVLERAEPDLVEAYRGRTLLNRLGEPEDIANAALFFASEEAAYITGAILPVSGGIWPSL